MTRIAMATNGELVKLDDEHMDYFLSKHAEETESHMKWEEVRFTHATGRCRTATDQIGRNVHIVKHGRALCGWKPNSDWSCCDDDNVTCNKCLNKVHI